MSLPRNVRPTAAMALSRPMRRSERRAGILQSEHDVDFVVTSTGLPSTIVG